MLKWDTKPAIGTEDKEYDKKKKLGLKTFTDNELGWVYLTREDSVR